MVCCLNTCFIDLGWAFWKSPGLFTLDLFSTWYLERHVQGPGLMMFSPFLCQLVPLDSGTFDILMLCAQQWKRIWKEEHSSKSWSHWADVTPCGLQGQIPLLGKALVLPFLRASPACCANSQVC